MLKIQIKIQIKMLGHEMKMTQFVLKLPQVNQSPFFQVINWAATLQVHPEKHGSKDFNGPSCKKILENSESLVDLLPPELKSFGHALVAFESVRQACFGQELDPTFKDKIEIFKQHFAELPDVNVFPKAHILFKHIGTFCDRNGPLGPFSEQSFESVHYKFAELWENYTRDMSHPEYAEKLFACVVDFNTQRI